MHADFIEEAWRYDGAVTYVRGTREPFPMLGPACKYMALFDDRPMFDALRLAFLVQADPHSGIGRMTTELQTIMRDHGAVLCGGQL